MQIGKRKSLNERGEKNVENTIVMHTLTEALSITDDLWDQRE